MKNPIIAFLLSFIPGLGHLYMNRPVRAFIYGCGFFGSLLLAFLMLVKGHRYRDELLLLLFVAFIVALINMIDMIVSLIRARPRHRAESGIVPSEGELYEPAGGDSERFQTILLSFIPGLGHLQLGLMQRGLVFLAGFFGITVMVLFVCFILRTGSFIAFLGVLPIIWLYSLFDIVQQLDRKRQGEPLIDRSVLEDFQIGREEGRKNKALATLLAIFPGAGHMYLGLQRRGLQLMAAFLFSVYILDALRLSLFMFIIPILWFYSFFDALQHISRQGREELRDVPIVDWLMNHQKWVGVALLALGAYYLVNDMGIDLLQRLIPDWNVTMWFHRYFQTFIVSVLLIGGGIRLMSGSRRK